MLNLPSAARSRMGRRKAPVDPPSCLAAVDEQDVIPSTCFSCCGFAWLLSKRLSISVVVLRSYVSHPLRSTESSGGAVVQSGVLELLSNSQFLRNRAANEGPAIISLGQFLDMANVLFQDNYQICDVDFYSGETEAVRRFSQ